MSKHRIISAQPGDDPQEERLNQSLRPTRIDDYVGQPKLIERLRITLQAVKERKEPMDHLLLHGPPGLGKTTLAHIVANEMGTHVVVTSGPALTKPGDLVGTLTKLAHGDILFIDEIHRLPATVEEYLYSAMEDFKIDIILDSGMHGKVITLNLKPFCLIGATTRAGLMTSPMRARFGIIHNLDFYSVDDLLKILHRNAALLNMAQSEDGDPPVSPPPAKNRGSFEALNAIARRSRGTPRIANRLLRRVRDYAQVKTAGKLTPPVVDAALLLEGVDDLGLDELDRKYLRVIADVYQGGPVGLEAVAATLGEDSGTLEDVVEPYLLQIGFLARTRKGRQLTLAGADRVGIKLPPSVSGQLFDVDDAESR
jgi:Holliday junction DNA helicase RuvB